ncbi:questin oxidase family protein [Streptomyces platensis]|uniref:questin oxidase family protein n=1 Tax=Streptomyces platensis TaxID=58346 RepID=UPI003D9F1020
MVRNGRARTVHRWLDTYARRLEDVPAPQGRITDANWQQALGDPGRVTDWTGYFTEQIAEHPWRELLAVWWPRLLPGIAGAATHPVIRVARGGLRAGGRPRRRACDHVRRHRPGRRGHLRGRRHPCPVGRPERHGADRQGRLTKAAQVPPDRGPPVTDIAAPRRHTGQWWCG